MFLCALYLLALVFAFTAASKDLVDGPPTAATRDMCPDTDSNLYVYDPSASLTKGTVSNVNYLVKKADIPGVLIVVVLPSIGDTPIVDFTSQLATMCTSRADSAVFLLTSTSAYIRTNPHLVDTATTDAILAHARPAFANGNPDNGTVAVVKGLLHALKLSTKASTKPPTKAHTPVPTKASPKAHTHLAGWAVALVVLGALILFAFLIWISDRIYRRCNFHKTGETNENITATLAPIPTYGATESTA
eukprot:NODE_1276_length_992_cov_268.566278_g978_i0.p1 GENE.NODE_1276_length_992_cov_268.566278_g978_i0~~NODE_1276_length_992_cov_268.566278_g978_i0.p1  ORF type:complete len:267 (-),score=75.01 NODE_1276_length_992_cov_268.566278_g978_i0:191-931(-)